MQPQIIGLTGLARSGKDTAASYLATAYGYTQLSFAAPLKDALDAMFGWDADWNDTEWKETVYEPANASPRYLAQTLGTEWGRNLIGEDLWVGLLEYTFRARLGGRPIVVSDVRFPNEAEWIQSEGGIVVEIRRPGAGTPSSHVSENGLHPAEPDIIVFNSGTLADLYGELDSILDKEEAA